MFASGSTKTLCIISIGCSLNYKFSGHRFVDFRLSFLKHFFSELLISFWISFGSISHPVAPFSFTFGTLLVSFWLPWAPFGQPSAHLWISFGVVSLLFVPPGTLPVQLSDSLLHFGASLDPRVCRVAGKYIRIRASVAKRFQH